ncbi:DUF4149 domain-containing protein [Vampirovibrio sp.]|uniref:DUF4149 domain-containing protein n=1 Tax=Vampirovibrio sp. TaxID=2717857 RepID=UPI003593E4B0
MNTKCCFLSSRWLSLGSGLQNLGFAIMAGGMLALGAFTAPVVFGQFSRIEAGPVMAIIFRRFDMVLQVALLLALLGESLRIGTRQLKHHGLLPALRWILLGALTLSLLYATQFLNADIERLNRAGTHRDLTTVAGRQFEQKHKLSEGIYKANLWIVILLILLTPFMDHPLANPKENRPKV